MGQGHPQWVGIVMRYPDGTVQAWQIDVPHRCTVRAEQKLRRVGGTFVTAPTAVEVVVQGYATDWPAEPGRPSLEQPEASEQGSPSSSPHTLGFGGEAPEQDSPREDGKLYPHGSPGNEAPGRDPYASGFSAPGHPPFSPGDKAPGQGSPLGMTGQLLRELSRQQSLQARLPTSD